MIRRAAIFSCVLLSVVVGCDDDFPIDPDPPILEVSPDPIGVLEGDTVRLTATLDGQAVPATWDVEVDSIATVSADGLVQGIIPGFTAITATASGNQTKSANVTVNAVTALTSGTAVTLASTAVGSRTLRKIVVPTGKTSLTVTFTPAAADTGRNADLYVRRSRLPTATVNDCASANDRTAESCVINNPPAGTWYIGVITRAAYSNASLRATVAP